MNGTSMSKNKFYYLKEMVKSFMNWYKHNQGIGKSFY